VPSDASYQSQGQRNFSAPLEHAACSPTPPNACRERAAGTYYSSAYFLAKMTADMVFQLPMPIIFSCIVYFLIGLQPLGGSWTCSLPLRRLRALQFGNQPPGPATRLHG
jgi:hypothetical protein